MFVFFWGCIPELHGMFWSCPKEVDMSNAASTWVGLAAGVIIGAVITWWVYNRQQKTSLMQDTLLNQIIALENKILSLEEKIESLLEKRNDQDANATLYLSQIFYFSNFSKVGFYMRSV
jgi:Na+/glutamate symporter